MLDLSGPAVCKRAGDASGFVSPEAVAGIGSRGHSRMQRPCHVWFATMSSPQEGSCQNQSEHTPISVEPRREVTTRAPEGAGKPVAISVDFWNKTAAQQFPFVLAPARERITSGPVDQRRAESNRAIQLNGARSASYVLLRHCQREQ